LTGKRCIDFSQASRTGIFDIQSKVFSEDLAKLFDIDLALFSKPVKSGEIIGTIKNDVKDILGINQDVYIVSGGHDQVCASIGSGVIDSTICSDGMGTVECLVATYDKPFNDFDIGKCGYPNVPFLSNYCTYLLNYSCGSLTRWWMDMNYSKEEIVNGNAFIDIEKDFSDKPTGLLVLPYFAGAATPYQDINAKGSIINLSLTDTPSKVYKGILEGLSYEMRLNLEFVKKIGVKPKKMVVTGGGSSSRKWLQIKSNILGIKIYPLKVKDAGILGCAILGVNALTKTDLNIIAKKFVKYDKVIVPDKEQKSKYNVIYKKYKKLYNDLKKYN
ncbi:MAG: hypothetical protein IJQ66_01555, partial [Clostridia bacterium]|nr:hypothetical protein [Clostridia bacterium]